MDVIILWLTSNWEFILLALWLAEKIVKLTPWPYDDIVIDILGQLLKKLFGLGKDKVSN